VSGNLILSAQGRGAGIAKIGTIIVDVERIDGILSVISGDRGLIHEVQIINGKTGVVKQIGSDVMVRGTIGTVINIDAQEIRGNLQVFAMGEVIPSFIPKGAVTLPFLSSVLGNLDLTHGGVVPAIEINKKGLSKLDITGSIRVGSIGRDGLRSDLLPMVFGLEWSPIEENGERTKATAYVGPTFINNVGTIGKNIEIVSNTEDDVHASENGDIIIAGQAFTVEGSVRMAAVGGEPLRTVHLDGLASLTTPEQSERRIYTVDAYFGNVMINNRTVDRDQIPDIENNIEFAQWDALCFSACRDSGFVFAARDGGCKTKTCTCFPDKFGTKCTAQASICTVEQYEETPLTSDSDRTCLPARTCGPGEHVSLALTATADRACSACPDGKFQSAANHTLGMCKDISRDAAIQCADGEIEIQPSISNDHYCERCLLGSTYTLPGDHEVCSPVQVCNVGEYAHAAATTTSDRKCKVCQVGSYMPDDEHTNDRCRDWAAFCPAGTFEYSAASSVMDRRCAQCDFGTFQSNAEFEGDTCEEWDDECSFENGTYEIVAPTATNNRECAENPLCEFGFLASKMSEPGPECTAFRFCGPGQYAADGNATTDRYCLPCPDGYYQLQVDHAEHECVVWPTCAGGTFKSIDSNASASGQCQDCLNLEGFENIPIVCLEYVKDSGFSSRKGGAAVYIGVALVSLVVIAGIVAFTIYMRKDKAPFKVVTMRKESNFMVNPNFATMSPNTSVTAMSMSSLPGGTINGSASDLYTAAPLVPRRPSLIGEQHAATSSRNHALSGIGGCGSDKTRSILNTDDAIEPVDENSYIVPTPLADKQLQGNANAQVNGKLTARRPRPDMVQKPKKNKKKNKKKKKKEKEKRKATASIEVGFHSDGTKKTLMRPAKKGNAVYIAGTSSINEYTEDSGEAYSVPIKPNRLTGPGFENSDGMYDAGTTNDDDYYDVDDGTVSVVGA
jgi:hypothetical protein